MPVRKTESKLPFQLTAEDLGQNTAASDGKSVLISFLTSPVVVNRLQQYVVFVTDTSQTSTVQEYNWTFNNAGNSTSQTTSNGYIEYIPSTTGNLSISVELRNSSSQAISTIQLEQEIVTSNPDLENLINAAGSSTPVAGNPITSREVINDFRAYIDQLVPRDADPDASENSLLFSITYFGAMQQNAQQRALLLERIANALAQDDKSELKDRARQGFGLCMFKPQVLAMFLTNGSNTILPFSPLPQLETERNTAINQLLDSLEGLSVNILIDLFNTLRFPKTNLNMCKQILDGIKSRYYSGHSYAQITQNRNTCVAFIEQFKNGPLGVP